MRKFYLKYPKCQTVSDKLSWSHICELIKLDDDLERSFYERQTVKGNWSVRELQRQIDSALFLRLAVSRDKEGILSLAQRGIEVQKPEDVIKSTYTLEFLNLPESNQYTESDLEQRLIDNLQKFLLELGKGFTFVGRQYKITINNVHYHVDLVFYHRILKCFVLIDLKKNSVRHEDIGQMNMYLGYFATEENMPDDNTPIGIIMSRNKDELLVEYATYTPNEIPDPEYSIDVGIQNFVACLREAGVESPLDMNNIKLALQGYNYGNGYISWAKENYGGYTYANAVEFSTMMAERNGWSSYGDKEYVSHVLRYYVFGRIPTGIGNQAIVQVALTQEGNGGDPYWSWYGFSSRVEWCACFVSWCADQCGYIESGVIPKFSLCSSGMEWFESRGQFMDGSYVPTSGDLIFFDWGNDGNIDHVGIVESVVDGTVYTVEGNSGDKVVRRDYPIGYEQIEGYGVACY